MAELREDAGIRGVIGAQICDGGRGIHARRGRWCARGDLLTDLGPVAEKVRRRARALLAATYGGKPGSGPAGLAPRRRSEVSDRRSSDWGRKRLQIW
ncbi:putative pollen-specific leucine-rich repeat extensin-like protein 3 [Iris pallida]|uniref:Pollen-specific leucine-rich repeat extensin-like protein 3 n=1 Tax=Iris pallida TaxID=29817 RepID=A0AAX6GX44_IRIPA|nr:putative pollen-specific leucine-rich repeat extensin-like protein 3 [Iris pallida]